MKEINITTIVGCPNLCSYCPQDVFLKNYKNDIRILTLDNFKILLQNINKDIVLNFAGFSENFLNPYFIDMLIHSNDLGYKICIYTTLVGFNKDKLNKLKENNVKFYLMRFHEYDGKNFNKKVFDDNVELFLTNLNVSHYEINKITNPNSRASNNKNFNIDYKKDRLYCNFWNRDLLFFENSITPDGNIYLCCMDFGLKHKIGNLFDYNYESEEFNTERNKILKLQQLEDSDLLCRSCEYSFNY